MGCTGQHCTNISVGNKKKAGPGGRGREREREGGGGVQGSIAPIYQWEIGRRQDQEEEGEREREGGCTGQHCTNISVGNRKKAGSGGRGRERERGGGVQGSIAPIYQWEIGRRQGQEEEGEREGGCTGQHCTNISVGNRKETGSGGRGRERRGGGGCTGQHCINISVGNRKKAGPGGRGRERGGCTGQHCTNISVGNRKKTGPGGRGRERGGGGGGVQGSIAPIHYVSRK